MKLLDLFLASAALISTASAQNVWEVDAADEWEVATDSIENAKIRAGVVSPSSDKEVYVSSKLHRFSTPRKAKAITLTQPKNQWANWQRIPSVGPKEQNDAPILLPISDGNYWFFAKIDRRSKIGEGPRTDYHAWHSTDMKEWKYVSRAAPNWATTAEYKDGKIYLYYDKPNDGKPHLVIGSDLDKKKPKWENKGLAFDDPSFGSDAGVIRTRDGKFQLISEDWSPINARKHSWDSPLALRSTSQDGLRFEIGRNVPPVDLRTKPTGEKGTYMHPVMKECYYSVHEPEQDAFGDWTNIQIGDDLYLFGDYHPAKGKIKGAIFHSSDIEKPYKRIGQFGGGHPDPTIGFAEGKFYLLQQRSPIDFVSTGPWANSVVVRVGVDTDNDGSVDQWTVWQQVEESYQQKEGFARVVDRTPAKLDLSKLPQAYGFKFEYKASPAALDNLDEHSSNVPPAIDSVRFDFE